MNIYDIAEKAGVSIATVSRVINGSAHVSEKTRQRINQIINEAEYTPNVFARGLMMQSSQVIGVLTSNVCDLYYATSIHTIEQELRKINYSMILCSTGDTLTEKQRYLQLLLDKHVDGVILVGSVFRDSKDNSHIFNAAKKVPVMLINSFLCGENIYSVLCDDYFGIYSATTHIIQKGRQRLLYLYTNNSFSSQEKRRGFLQCIENHPDITGQAVKVSPYTTDCYQEITNLLDSSAHFDAVLTCDDVLAARVNQKCHEIGLTVPQDISIMGYNDSQIAECTIPQLSTVDSKAEIISASAVKTLISVLEGKPMPIRTVISPDLVVRSST